MRRVATIDVGTNTALLLVADVGTGPGGLSECFEEERFVRLGEAVDATREIQPAALERLREALLGYRAVAEAWGAEAVVAAGTSASRDARNRGALVDFVRRETGLAYEILSGEEEARWSYAGAVSALPDLDGPCAVVDIGGGSTEIVVGRPGPGDVPLYRRSLDVASVRLTEGFFSAQPPGPDEVAAAEAYTRRLVAAAAPSFDAGTTLLGTAGTVLALAYVAEAAAPGAPFPRELTLDAETVGWWSASLRSMTREEVLALNPGVMAGRADVFPAGVLVLEVLMREMGFSACRVSPRGLRHGLALRWQRAQR